MGNTEKYREWMDEFQNSDLSKKDFSELEKDVLKIFPKLGMKEQAMAAGKLASEAGSPNIPDLIEKLFTGNNTSLPALLKFSEPMQEKGLADNFIIEQMQLWVGVCNDSGEDFNAIGFYSLPENIQNSVADYLAGGLRGSILMELKLAAPDKKASKRIGKYIHKAKSKGAVIAQVKEETEIPEPSDENIEEIYISPPDATGTIFIYLYKTVFGKNTLFIILINDQEGVLRFDSYKVPEIKFRNMLESTKKNPHAIIVKVDPVLAKQLIKNAEDAGIRKQRAHPEAFKSSRRAIGVAEVPDDPHPLWSIFDEEEMTKSKGLVARSDELLNHRMFLDWQLVPIEEGKLIVELQEMNESVIELSDKQKAERVLALYEKEAAEILNTQGKDLWFGRIVNCAYLLHKLGEEEEAKIAAALALAFTGDDTAVPVFFTKLIARTVAKDMAPEEQEKNVKPGQGGILIE
jgi:hypothetical protein